MHAKARVLALQVADPERLTRADADRLLKDGPAHFLHCYLSGLLARSPIAEETMRSWMKSADEFPREMGCGILGARLKNHPGAISDADAEKVLTTIEKEIQRSPNWARYAMNGALISIGVFKPTLRKRAIEAAKRIGKVEVDHGETKARRPTRSPTSRRRRSGSAARDFDVTRWTAGQIETLRRGTFPSPLHRRFAEPAEAPPPGPMP